MGLESLNDRSRGYGDGENRDGASDDQPPPPSWPNRRKRGVRPSVWLFDHIRKRTAGRKTSLGRLALAEVVSCVDVYLARQAA